MKPKLIALTACICSVFLAEAQSYHFSQFYTTPLLVNPAFTGNTDGPYRAAVNFRSQWVHGGTPYVTTALSFDGSPLRKRLPEGNRAGAGLVVLSDRSLGGALQTNAIGISLAYNLMLDAEAVHSIGAGFQGTYQQRRIDLTKLTFENQFGSNGFDPSIPVAEPIANTPRNYFDANAGLLYSYSPEGFSVFISAAAYNLLQHKENDQAEEFRIPLRYTFLGGGRFEVGESGNLYFSLSHLRQSTANETTIGGAYGFPIGTDENQELNIGLWYRVKDAFIPYIGYQLNSFQLGLSYDYTVSPLKSGSTVRNAFELSFVYKAEDKTEMKRLVPWY